MYKEIWKYALLVMLVAIACLFILHCIYKNPWEIGLPYISWFIRLLIYILLGAWLIHIHRKEDALEIGFCAGIIPVLGLLINQDWTSSNLLQIGPFSMLSWYGGFGIVVVWIIWILISKSKTLFGFILIVNLILTLLIFLPYGIPNINFGIYPLYTLSGYTPFSVDNSSWFTLFLDIRALTSAVFVGYLIVISASAVRKLKYAEKLEKEIENQNQALVQFFTALAYFIWNFVRMFIFYLVEFFRSLAQNFLNQIKNSIQAYIVSLVIVMAFVAPLIIHHMGNKILEYNALFPSLTGNVTYLTSFLGILVTGTSLFLIPILLLGLLKGEYFPFQFYGIQVAERPRLFVPVFIAIVGIGLASLISVPMMNSAGLYLILFLGILIFSTVWGFANSQRT